VVDHTRPAQMRRSQKLKILRCFFSIASLTCQDFILSHPEQVLCFKRFTSQPLNELFIFNVNLIAAARNITFTDIHFKLLLAKKFLTNKHTCFRSLEPAFRQLHVHFLRFSFKFVNLCTRRLFIWENKSGCFWNSLYNCVCSLCLTRVLL